MNMNLILTSVLAAFCLAQSACGGTDDDQQMKDADYEPLSADEGVSMSDPSLAESTERSHVSGEFNPKASPDQSTHEPEDIYDISDVKFADAPNPDENSDMLATQCTGYGGCYNCWCLARCSKTGSTLHVVGSENQVGYGNCVNYSEWWCGAVNLGYRTHACWGKP